MIRFATIAEGKGKRHDVWTCWCFLVGVHWKSLNLLAKNLIKSIFTGSLITANWIISAAHCVGMIITAEEIEKCAKKGKNEK